MEIGQIIRQLRKERNLTQKKLGELSGINEVQIRQYELGKANPKLETLKKIAAALGVALNSFLDGNWEEYSEEIKADFESDVEGTSFAEPILIKQLSQYYEQLNTTGKREAVKRVSELAQLPEYTD